MNPYARVYRLQAPPDRHVRSACEEVRCEAWQSGWETYVDESTALGREQADYIRHHSGRTFTEHRSGDLVSVSASWNPPTEPVVAQITVFRFERGQRCFAEHRTRPQRFGVYDGGPLTRQHVSSVDWLEDCGEHLGRVVTQKERG